MFNLKAIPFLDKLAIYSDASYFSYLLSIKNENVNNRRYRHNFNYADIDEVDDALYGRTNGIDVNHVDALIKRSKNIQIHCIDKNNKDDLEYLQYILIFYPLYYFNDHYIEEHNISDKKGISLIQQLSKDDITQMWIDDHEFCVVRVSDIKMIIASFLYSFLKYFHKKRI